MTQVREAQESDGSIDDLRGGGGGSSDSPFSALELLKEDAADASPKTPEEQFINDRLDSAGNDNVPTDERKAMGRWLQDNFDRLRGAEGIDKDDIGPNDLAATYVKSQWPDGTPLSDADKAMIGKVADHYQHLIAPTYPGNRLTKEGIDTLVSAPLISTENNEIYIQRADNSVKVWRANGGELDWSPDGNYTIRAPGGLLMSLKPDGTGSIEMPNIAAGFGLQKLDLEYADGYWQTTGEHKGAFKIKIDENGVKFVVNNDVEMEMTNDGKMTGRVQGGLSVTNGPDGKLTVTEKGKSNKVWIEDGKLCWSDMDTSNKECQ